MNLYNFLGRKKRKSRLRFVKSNEHNYKNKTNNFYRFENSGGHSKSLLSSAKKYGFLLFFCFYTNNL